jgi:hypothetical protein
MHLAEPAATATATTATTFTTEARASALAPSGLTAGRAPLGFVGVPSVGVKLLLLHREGEGRATVGARQGSFLKSHW